MSETMTLREGLQELTEQLREQGKMVVLLDAMLAQTADADAEQSRLARIGELVEDIYASRSHLQLSHVTGNPSAIIASSSVWVGDAYSRKHEQGTADTLLAALEALRAKTEGGVMADGKAARCDACGHIFDRDERRYSDFWYDQSDEGRIVAVCGPCQGVFPPKSCPSCATLRAELDTAKARAEFLETSVPGHVYGELMDSRAELERLRAGLRELDARIQMRFDAAAVGHHSTGMRAAYAHVRRRLRELDLITEARDE